MVYLSYYACLNVRYTVSCITAMVDYFCIQVLSTFIYVGVEDSADPDKDKVAAYLEDLYLLLLHQPQEAVHQELHGLALAAAQPHLVHHCTETLKPHKIHHSVLDIVKLTKFANRVRFRCRSGKLKLCRFFTMFCDI